MNVSICLECKEILAAGAFDVKVPATHRVKGRVHKGSVVVLPEDPMEPGETPTEYFKRLKKTYKGALFP